MVHVLHGVYFNFLVLSLTRCRPQLSHVVVGTLNQTTCNVNSPNTFETLIHKNVTDIAFSIVPNIYIFWLYQSIGFQAKYVSDGATITLGSRFPEKNITLQHIFYLADALKRQTLKWAR